MLDAIAAGLRKSRQNAGLSVQQVSVLIEETGLKISPKTIYGWEAGRSKPDIGTFLLLCVYYGIDDVLETFGLGDERSATPNEILAFAESAHIKKYRALDERGRETVNCVLDWEYSRASVDSLQADDGRRFIFLPEILQKASAGAGYLADDEISEQIKVIYNPQTAKADYVMAVSGDSMEPEIMDGAKLLIREQPAIEDGEVGIFFRDGERYVKHFSRGFLVSTNPAYSDIPLNEDSRCVGKVIGILEPEWIVVE